MKNYYHTLGLNDSAGEDDIRRAYRNLAKQFHPDINSDPSAHDRFLEIHEAYEYLIDPSRRTRTTSGSRSAPLSKEELARREHIYKEWLRHQQEAARQRAEGYAKQTFSEFRESKWYRIARGVNKAYNYLFLVLCAAIISIPLYKYVEQFNLPDDEQMPFAFFAVPVIAGLVFAGWGYYYWFILKHDEI